MFGQKQFPILEFDTERKTHVNSSHKYKLIENLSEYAVLCFFPEAIEKIVKYYPNKIVDYINAPGIKSPIYEINYNNQKIVLTQAFLGSPMAAGQIENLCSLGCTKIIACGVCGVLENLDVGHLIIPTSAIRDEGTSYHYIAPNREIETNKLAVKAIEEILTKSKIPFVKGKTWTTDAIYRETIAKTNLRKKEGCIAVEMETSAFIAASEYLDITFGQILYSGDNLALDQWEHRDYNSLLDIREMVLRLSIDACLNL